VTCSIVDMNLMLDLLLLANEFLAEELQCFCEHRYFYEQHYPVVRDTSC
jgi:hypothetical protein